MIFLTRRYERVCKQCDEFCQECEIISKKQQPFQCQYPKCRQCFPTPQYPSCDLRMPCYRCRNRMAPACCSCQTTCREDQRNVALSNPDHFLSLKKSLVSSDSEYFSDISSSSSDTPCRCVDSNVRKTAFWTHDNSSKSSTTPHDIANSRRSTLVRDDAICLSDCDCCDSQQPPKARLSFYDFAPSQKHMSSCNCEDCDTPYMKRLVYLCWHY